MKIEQDFKEFIKLLNLNNVKYLVVGGFAFSIYSEPRFTKDIDIFIENSDYNAQKILNVLSEFGFSGLGLQIEDFLEEGNVIQLGYSPVRIDILTSISGVKFKNAWENKTTGKYGEELCYFISKNDLIKNKKTIGRLQDLADIEKLQK